MQNRQRSLIPCTFCSLLHFFGIFTHIRKLSGVVCCNRRLIMQNRQRSLIPCTALGIMELITRSRINLAGKEAVLMGDSNVVGTPLAMLLRDSGIAAHTICRCRSVPLVPPPPTPNSGLPFKTRGFVGCWACAEGGCWKAIYLSHMGAGVRFKT